MEKTILKSYSVDIERRSVAFFSDKVLDHNGKQYIISANHTCLVNFYNYNDDDNGNMIRSENPDFISQILAVVNDNELAEKIALAVKG